MIPFTIAGVIIALMLFFRFKPKFKKRATQVSTAPTTTTTTAPTTPPATTKTARSFSWSIAVIAILVIMLIWALSGRESIPDRSQSQSAPSYAPAPIAQIAAEAPAPAPAPEKWELCVKNICDPVTVITLTDSIIELEQVINGIKVTFSGSVNEGNFTGTWEKDGISDTFSLGKKLPALYVGKEQSGKNAFPMKLKRV